MHIRTHMRMHHKAISRIVMYPLPTQYDTHPYTHTLTLLFSPVHFPPRTTYAFKERSCRGRHQTGTAVCGIPLLQTVLPGRTHARKNKTHGSLGESRSGDKCRRNQRGPMQHWRTLARKRKGRRSLTYFQLTFDDTLQPVHNHIAHWAADRGLWWHYSSIEVQASCAGRRRFSADIAPLQPTHARIPVSSIKNASD